MTSTRLHYATKDKPKFLPMYAEIQFSSVHCPIPVYAGNFSFMFCSVMLTYLFMFVSYNGRKVSFVLFLTKMTWVGNHT
jgi:hypothetical protein